MFAHVHVNMSNAPETGACSSRATPGPPPASTENLRLPAIRVKSGAVSRGATLITAAVAIAEEARQQEEQQRLHQLTFFSIAAAKGALPRLHCRRLRG